MVNSKRSIRGEIGYRLSDRRAAVLFDESRPLALDDLKFGQGRVRSGLLGPERIGQPVTLRLSRAGEIRTVTVTIAAHP